MNTNSHLQAKLAQSLKNIHQNLPLETQNKLLTYLEKLDLWNQAYNLTAIESISEMIDRHVADSLTLLPFFEKNRGNHLDVGTGAGLPGIPLALALPEHHFTLLDSNGKKIRFLREVQWALNLNTINPVKNRVEKYEGKFDTILTRAFAPLDRMLKQTEHLANSHTRWLAMKGIYPKDELKKIDSKYDIIQVHAFSKKRHLVICQLNQLLT